MAPKDAIWRSRKNRKTTYGVFSYRCNNWINKHTRSVVTRKFTSFDCLDRYRPLFINSHQIFMSLTFLRSRTSEIHGRETRGEREKNLRHEYCYISGNKESFLLLIFCKSWRIYLAIVFSSCHTWNNSAGNGEIPQRHPKIENLVYDKKKDDHTRAEYRTKNVSIEMIVMKASKVIIIRLSYCFVSCARKYHFLGQKWARNSIFQ